MDGGKLIGAIGCSGGTGKLEWQKAHLAMSVRGKNSHYRLSEIQRRHFVATALRCGLGAEAEGLIQGLVERTDGVIAAVSRELPEGFPDGVAGAVLEGLRMAARRLGKMLGSEAGSFDAK